MRIKAEVCQPLRIWVHALFPHPSPGYNDWDAYHRERAWEWKLVLAMSRLGF